MKTLVMAAAMAVGVTACASSGADGVKADAVSGVTQGVKDRIALCAAGSSARLGVDVEAKIGKTLQEGGKLSAGLKQEIQGAILQKVDAKDAPKVYETYVSCIEKPLH